MYCPDCNQEHDGKFCPECGTKLVEDAPASSGASIGIGDYANIAGDIHLTDSHNVHNEDKSVHNITNTTSTINNITQVERQKTEQEIFEEKKNQFLEKCKQLFADGILESRENIALEAERVRLGLDSDVASQLIESARRSSSFRLTSLSPRDTMTMRLLTATIRSNNATSIKQQLPRLEALAKAYAVDEVQYKYYLVLAALFPEKLVEKYEANTSDEYWKTFWVYIAYLKLGNLEKAERAATRLPLYTQYSDENGMLLSIVGVLNDFGKEAAIDYLNAIMGTYSDVLQLLHHALALAIDPLKAEELKANKSQCAFYLEYIITLESPEARAERLAKEKAEAEAAAAREREKAAAHVTYTLTLTGITDELKATMSARVFLGWATTQSRENFAKLPVPIKTTDNLDEAKTLYRKLVAGGMTIQTDAINGLNEKVDAKLGYDTEAENKYLDDAQAGNAEAQYNLAECYYNGELGLEKDYAKAVEWYTKAAEQGHAQAQNELGLCYDEGNGVAQDYSKAVEWYRKAAEQGHTEAKAKTNFKLELKISTNTIKKYTTNFVLQIPNGFTAIIRGPIDSHVCGIVKEIVFPKSVTKIGSWAFHDFTNLTSVTIPNCVIEICSHAFQECTSLTDVIIPDSMTKIGDSAFYGCTRLTLVNIPDSITKIGESAFHGCARLTSVNIPDSVTMISNGFFRDCSGLASIVIPNSVTKIGNWAFWGCTGLTSITIPDSVTEIGDYAFKGCCRLTVKIPKSLTNIGENAFQGCKGTTYY